MNSLSLTVLSFASTIVSPPNTQVWGVSVQVPTTVTRMGSPPAGEASMNATSCALVVTCDADAAIRGNADCGRGVVGTGETGVFGQVDIHCTGTSSGVYGVNNFQQFGIVPGGGVRGDSNIGTGVVGYGTGLNGRGVMGLAWNGNANARTWGGYFNAEGGQGIGLVGEYSSVQPPTGYPTKTGVYGVSHAQTGPAYGGFFSSETNDQAGIGAYGQCVAGTGVKGYGGVNGVYGESYASNGNGVVGLCNSGASAWGVAGTSAEGQGVVGRAGPEPLPGGGFPPETGVVGYSGTSLGVGVYGENQAGGLAGQFLGDVCVTGTISTTAASVSTNATCPSDARYKEHVSTLSGALALVDRLRGVSFEWKRDEFPSKHFPEGPQIGVIAQEVRETLPELVLEGRDGYLAVDYAKLTPVLIEALHELKSQYARDIADRDAEIASIRADLGRIESALASSNVKPTQPQSR